MAKIVIIGGGVIGSSIAYHLAQAGNASDVVVVEPDPTYEFAATLRATGGIRQLYTVPENIRMSQYGHEVYGQFETLMAVNGEPPGILLALAKVEFGQPKHFGREPANILNSGSVSDAGPASDRSGFYDACRVENGHIRLFAKEVLTRLRRIKPVTVS